VPLLIGSNSQEGNIFAFQLSNNSMYMSKEQYSYLNDLFMSPHGLGLLGPAWYSSLYQSGDFWHTFGNSFSDYALTCGTRMIANAYSAKSAAPVYRYLFSHTPDLGPLKMLNATHATEIPYVFYHTRRFSPREVTLSAEITSMWSNVRLSLSLSLPSRSIEFELKPDAQCVNTLPSLLDASARLDATSAAT